MRVMKFAAAVAMVAAGCETGGTRALKAHPESGALTRAVEWRGAAGVQTTGVTREDYLKLIAGNVDFFKGCQDSTGAIIDPVSHGERQYSTPAFAASAGVLIKYAGRTDLVGPATRAMTCALDALVEKRPADQHADFYIPLLVHAYRSLKGVVPAEQAAAWEKRFREIDPETMYRPERRTMNWNLVSDSGELLRRKDGLVEGDKLDAQMAYLERCLDVHVKLMKPAGLYKDPHSPLAYDAFARLWLEDAYADDAYSGKYSAQIGAWLRTGGLSTLLMLSPSGEWASGGRSALHNWNEAVVAVICECEAARWKREGRGDVAAMFKRAAHLGLRSMQRWQRPSGELFIIKNRAEPAERLAYETYSNHSQYNLLPMAMLAIAYERADESVSEGMVPSEVGGYVFDLRDTFHKVVAGAGGYYVLVDTGADPHYDATGLQRVHRAGVAFPALSDSAAGERDYQPEKGAKEAMAPGVQWQEEGKWVGLADYVGGKGKRSVVSAELRRVSEKPEAAEFVVTYLLSEGRKVTERYVVSAGGVELTTSVSGHGPFRLSMPVLVSDGAADLPVTVEGRKVEVEDHGSVTEVEVPTDMLTDGLRLERERVVTHNGWVRRAVAGMRGSSVVMRVTLR